MSFVNNLNTPIIDYFFHEYIKSFVIKNLNNRATDNLTMENDFHIFFIRKFL